MNRNRAESESKNLGVFHTPPPLEKRRSDVAQLESYGGGSDNSGIADSDSIANNLSGLNLSEDVLTHELPARLNGLVDGFIRSLKEPKYSKPLTADDISDLYQSFYTEFREQAWAYLKEGLRKGSGSIQSMETFNEIAEKKKERSKRQRKLVEYLEIAEAKACSTVYDKIFWFPFSGEDQATNEFVEKRVEALRQVPITFKHLDIEGLSENDVQSSLATAGDTLRDMDKKRTPREKLLRLLDAHKEIVESLTGRLPNSSSTSADLVLPTLIYVLVQFEVPNLWLNLLFMSRFRNQSLLAGEDPYCLTNYEAAVKFLQSLSLDSLGLSANDLPGNSASTLFPPNSFTETSSHSRTSSTNSNTVDESKTTERGVNRRLSMLHATDIADQSLRSLGSTYRFFMSKISQSQANVKADGNAFPHTLEEARTLVGLDAPSSDKPSEDTPRNLLGANTKSDSFMNRFSGGVLKGFKTVTDEKSSASTPTTGDTEINTKALEPLKPPSSHLVTCKTADLKYSDIADLHAEYKTLVAYLKSIGAFEG